MSVLDRLAQAIQRSRESAKSRNELQKVVFQAVADGVLTEVELAEIERRREELGLSAEDLNGLRTEVFQAALKAVKQDGRLTPEEENSLLRIADHFSVPRELVQRSMGELARYRLLYEIERGNLPREEAVGLVLRKGELVHWSEPAVLLEERVLRRRYEGGSSGVSFRIMKGVTYRIGGHRGQMVAETGIVPVSRGQLVLTSKRFIFRGDQKSISVTWDKLLDIELFRDGLRASLTNRQKPALVQFDRPDNADIVGAIVSSVVNQFETK